MSAAARRFELCPLEQIDDPGSHGFAIEIGATVPLRLFVVRRGDTLAAYRNRCPHTGAPLEWQPHRFLDLDNRFVQCAIHGALFRPEDGFCVRGPCAGKRLKGLALVVEDGRLFIDLPVDAAAE